MSKQSKNAAALPSVSGKTRAVGIAESSLRRIKTGCGTAARFAVNGNSRCYGRGGEVGKPPGPGELAIKIPSSDAESESNGRRVLAQAAGISVSVS